MYGVNLAALLSPIVGVELILPYSRIPSYNILITIHGVNSSYNLCYCWVQEGNYEWGILVNNIS